METVTITKLWHHPGITINVDNTGIQFSIPLDDFLSALTQEIGSVTWVLTQKSFSAKMITAKEKVLEGIKAESLKVIKKEK